MLLAFRAIRVEPTLFVVTEGISRQLRVLHVVSSGGIADSMQPFAFMPLLTRLPKQRVKVQVVSLSPGCVRAAVLRQQGVPVHDVALSRARFELGGFKELMTAVHAFRPDVIQAWGHTAQLVSGTIRKRCDWSPAVIWNVTDTIPLAKDAGFVDRQKLKLVAKAAQSTDRIVYASEAAAAHHRRAGYPEQGYAVIAPGVDAARFKPDPAARTKVRERLHVPHDSFVVGMVAPFRPEYDHASFLKGVAELIKTHPNLYVLLAGHGVQRGNAPLMTMIGGGALSQRIQLLGEWSDLTSLFNACDLVCSSALTDNARMTLAMAMACGIPCVATGIGAQGELIGQYGVAIEPGNPSAFVRGIGKILAMPQERRLHLAQSARKYALQNLVYVRSLQKYLQLYGELVGKELIAQTPIAAPEVDVNAPLAVVKAEPPPKKKPIVVEDLADPDSLEAKVAPVESEELPKWRIEQEQARAEQDARVSASKAPEGDVLQIFEMELAKPSVAPVTPMSERARGVVEEFEELLPVEVLTAPAPASDAKPSATAAEPKANAQSETKTHASAEAAVARNGAEAVATTQASAETTPTPSTAEAKAPANPELDAAELRIVDSTATLPPTQALATLESGATTAGDAKTEAEPEPVQASLFDLDLELAPEPERKAVSG